MTEEAAAIYAWKICSPDRPDAERIGTMADLESCLDASGLAGANPSTRIIAQTLSMQSEGQGYYKSSADPDSRWTLTWLELRSDPPGLGAAAVSERVEDTG
jgi:hypothetical protein